MHATEYFARYIVKRCVEKTRRKKCYDIFMSAYRTFCRNEQILLNIFPQRIVDGDVDFGHPYVPSKELLDRPDY